MEYIRSKLKQHLLQNMPKYNGIAHIIYRQELFERVRKAYPHVDISYFLFGVEDIDRIFVLFLHLYDKNVTKQSTAFYDARKHLLDCFSKDWGNGRINQDFSEIQKKHENQLQELDQILLENIVCYDDVVVFLLEPKHDYLYQVALQKLIKEPFCLIRSCETLAKMVDSGCTIKKVVYSDTLSDISYLRNLDINKFAIMEYTKDLAIYERSIDHFRRFELGSEKDREIFIMYIRNGMSAAEISKELKISRGTVITKIATISKKILDNGDDFCH